MKPVFNNEYTRLEREIISSLAAIEEADKNACANCGGEDCVCCEIYQDRQQWESPDDLFASMDNNPEMLGYIREPEEDDEYDI